MNVVAFQQSGYRLLHDGARELARMEANGMRIDVPKLKSTRLYIEKHIRDLKNDIEGDKAWRAWRKRFGDRSKLKARDQLGFILYEYLGIPRVLFTQKGKASTKDEVLQSIDNPFVRKVAEFYRYEKALNNYIAGIERELVGDRIHPVFNLHLVSTYRSSCDNPNIQNVPTRNKDTAKLIRSLFIPSSPRHVLPENDFKGVEVGVSACYHKDANFIRYLKGEGDMHRDMAAQLYMLKPEQVSKDARYGAKNRFVFPQFYGDYYVACAKNLWDWLLKARLKVEGTDILVIDHLKSRGIKVLGACNPDEEPHPGSFEYHVKQVENDFWNNRFRQYGKWRKDYYRDYLDKGYFDILTGFRVSGFCRRNEVINYGTQGAAFHCLLWTLIQVGRKLRRYKMSSKLIGQIHDSLIGDTPITELKNYWEIIEETVSVDLRKHFEEWLIVPLEIEYEIPPSTGTWFDKKPVKFKQGRFKHPDPERNTWTDDVDKFIAVLNRYGQKV